MKWRIYTIVIILCFCLIFIVIKSCNKSTYEEEIKDDKRMTEGVNDLEKERVTIRERINNILSNYMPD